MARNTNTAATLPATVATVAPTHAARAANAHKYGVATHKALPAPAQAYTVTPHGMAVAANGGRMGGANPTVMGCVALAAAHLAAKGRPLTQANLAAAMQALPAIRAVIGASRAVKYASGGQYCNAWLGGYIAGAARNNATGGLLTKA